MILEPIIEGGGEAPALGFGAVRVGNRVRVPVLWVGLKFAHSRLPVKLHDNTNHEILEITWAALEPGVYEEEVIFHVIQD